VKERVTREVKVMARLNHANIVRYYDSWFDDWAPQLSHGLTTQSILTVGNTTNSTSHHHRRPAASPASVMNCLLKPPARVK